MRKFQIRIWLPSPAGLCMLLPANAAEGNPGLARDPIHASNSISVGPGCKEGGAPRALPPDGLTHLLESVTSHSRISAPMFGHTHTHTHTHTLRMWGGICLRELQTTHPSATRQEGSLAKNNTHARNQPTNQPHGPRTQPIGTPTVGFRRNWDRCIRS